MEVLRCIIIEDEPIAAEIIADYVSAIPFLEYVGSFTNPMEAIHWLMKNQVDVIFLDINMPRIKGYEFITAANGNYQYIITTAYQEFAVDSYQWGVVDYLLKPVDFARFTSAVAKLKVENKQKVDQNQVTETITPLYRYFNVNKSYVKVCVNDIRYIESVREYLKISTNQQTITTKGKLSDLESEFKMLNIIRIHRSFMINLNHIGSFNHNEVWIEGQSFPIGRHYKETTITILNGMVNKV
ncbi:MAG: response regulator transcription factor [Saprospiraceae bacterium]|nr:response regulator transcription factor [Saprospiraceae bacterium]